MPIVFDAFVQKLQNRLQEPLPGAVAHEPLRAVPIGAVKPNFTHRVNPKPGSVLVLLYPDQGKISFPLIKRPEYVGAHSGQVSFPGGKAEQGESPIETALREGEEEIGIRPSSVEVIGCMSEFYVIPSNIMVTPVVAVQRDVPAFTPDPGEVVRILTAGIEDLLRADAVKEKDILAANVYPMRAPHFLVENEIVWGATAMMMNELRLLLQDINRG